MSRGLFVAPLVATLLLLGPGGRAFGEFGGAATTDRPSDHAAEVRVLYRVAACGAGPIPAGFEVRAVEAHCRAVQAEIDHYRRTWLAKASAFCADVLPQGLTETEEVVYPFGGADLLTALATFTHARVITAISLEPGGDVRALGAPQRGLERRLRDHRTAMRQLLRGDYSATVVLGALARTELSLELFLDLVALVVNGYEPLALRYVDLQSDGSLRYRTEAELHAARLESNAKRRTTEQPAFASFELSFRKLGDPQAPIRQFRHIAFNLDDEHLAADPSLLRHLEAKGRVVAMTKAASFLLWTSKFTLLRQYLIDHIDWMISDASGIPPEAASAGGLEQITYGSFDGPLFTTNTKENQRTAFRALWKQQPYRALSFRYGYPDVKKRPHLVVTRPRRP